MINSISFYPTSLNKLTIKIDERPNLLIIEAHSDDSAISIGGFLDKYKGLYNYHFALATASDIRLNHFGKVMRTQRLDEYQAYVERHNGTWHQTHNLPLDADGLLDTVPKRTLVSAFENIINTVKPKILICQGPSFHHDHYLVYEAIIAATRPTALFMPDEIYIMENPTYVHSLGPQTDFKANVYIALDEEKIDKKLATFRECFPSQQRDRENYLSEEGIKTWARYRGIEARCKYAEALQTYIRKI